MRFSDIFKYFKKKDEFILSEPYRRHIMHLPPSSIAKKLHPVLPSIQGRINPVQTVVRFLLSDVFPDLCHSIYIL